MRPNIAVMGIPGKWSTEVLADRLAERTGQRQVFSSDSLVVDLHANRASLGGIDLSTLDAVVVKKINEVYSADTDDRLRLLQFVESLGVRVFSPASSILSLVNRLSGTLALRNADIPMPPTQITEDLEYAQNIVAQWGRVVLKPMYSTKARGMTILDAEDSELDKKLALFQTDNAVMYMQQALDLEGQDLGMVFVGGEYLCTYARVAGNDSWNTTIHSGGRYENYSPSESLIELGRQAQACLNLDFTTVDIALTSDGPVVFEVSAFGGFRGALEGCGIDAAQHYADHIIKALK